MAGIMSSPDPAPPPLPLPELSFGGYAGRPGQLEGVGFWPRAGARALDLLVHFIATYSAGFAFGIFIGIAAVLAHGTENAAPYVQAAVGKLQGATLLPFMAGLVGATVYEIVCEAGHGSTLGKMLLGMTVVREDGGFCGLKAATVRSLGYYVDALFFGVVGYYAMQGNMSQQRHGDRWAKTVVCKRSSLRPDQVRSGVRFAAMFALAMIADGAAFLMALTVALIG